MGQNGSIGSYLGNGYPAVEFGEDVAAADFIGFRDDANTRRIGFKAFAGATGSGKVQLAARGVVASIKPKGQTDAIVAHKWRINFPFPLPSTLTAIKAGDPVYLDVTTPGAVTKTAPATTGQLLQVLGYAYWHGDDLAGIPSGQAATGMVVDIQPATVVP